MPPARAVAGWFASFPEDEPARQAGAFIEAKVREYAAIPSIRRYVIVESTSVGITVLERFDPSEAWRTTILTEGDILRMPEIAIEIPIADIDEDIAFPENEVG